jgi:hypothetical protein
MAMPFGLQFMPGAQQPNGEPRSNGPGGPPRVPLQQAIQILSMRRPRVYGSGAQAVVPELLLNAAGGMGQFAARGNVTAQALAMLAGVPTGPISAPAMPLMPSSSEPMPDSMQGRRDHGGGGSGGSGSGGGSGAAPSPFREPSRPAAPSPAAFSLPAPSTPAPSVPSEPAQSPFDGGDPDFGGGHGGAGHVLWSDDAGLWGGGGGAPSMFRFPAPHFVVDRRPPGGGDWA